MDLNSSYLCNLLSCFAFLLVGSIYFLPAMYDSVGESGMDPAPVFIFGQLTPS